MAVTERSARGLAAFPCGLCYSTLADDPPLSPYFMYLVAHPDGYVLFDCGLPAEQFVGVCSVIIDGVTYRIEADGSCSTLALLKAFGLTPADLKAVVLSHLHFDHAGGLPSLSRVQTLVQEEELAAVLEQPEGDPLWFRPSAELIESQVVALQGDHDIFGDQSVVVLKTPGHTPGHQCLFVRLDTGESFILGADIVYYPYQFLKKEIPSVAWSKEASLASCDRMSALIVETEARLLLSHDPEFLSTISLAPNHYYGIVAGK